MTAITGGGAPWPILLPVTTPAAFTTTQLLIDAAGEKAAAIFTVPKTGTLDKCEFFVTNVTGAAAGLRVSFQNVDMATGFPDATQDQYRAGVAVAANTWVVPGLMTADGTDGGAKRAVTRGDLLAVVVEFESFAALDAVRVAALTRSIPAQFPYCSLYTAAWALVALAEPFVVLKYDDGTYAVVHLGALAANVLTAHTVNTGTTPDEAGLIFQVPFACKIDRLWFQAILSGDAEVIVYDSDGATALATVPLDLNVKSGANAGWYEVMLGSDISLAAATNYRAVVKPTSVTSLSMYSFDVASVEIMAALPGGVGMHWTQRTDAGAWTETTTRRPLISIGISDVTITSSGTGTGASQQVVGGRFRRGIKENA